MKSNSFPCFTRLQYPVLLLLVTLFLLPLPVTAQNLDSRSGDEAALAALAGSLSGLGSGWSTSGMSLDTSIDGVTVESIGGELRVTRIDLKNQGLGGNIEVPAIGNLKELRYFNVYINRLKTQVPQELVDLPKLEYLYLSTGTPSSLDYANNDPHEIAAGTGSGDVHPGKNKGDEGNIITGMLPAPTDPSASVLKWLVVNWTDSAVDATDGLSGVDPDLFNVTTFEGLHIFNNNGIADFSFPSGISNMTNLDQLAIGVEKSGRDTGPLTGSVPADFGTSLSNLRHVRLSENPGLTLDYDAVDFSGLTSMRTWAVDIIGLKGNLPAEFFDGTMPNLLVMGAGWPRNNTPGPQGAHPEVNPDIGIKVYQYRNASLTSLPASLWSGYGGIIQPEFTDNQLTTIGTSDLTQQRQLRYLRLSGNELHEPWPYLDWTNHDPINGGVEFGNNRYVFKHMLYVPPNAPNGETVLQLWQNISGNDVSYSSQKPFGQSRTISYAAGSDVTIDDFDGIVTHPDNRYQWQKDGSDINGATSRSLTIAGAGEPDAGTYRLVVTNPGAPALTLTSEPVEVVVN